MPEADFKEPTYFLEVSPCAVVSRTSFVSDKVHAVVDATAVTEPLPLSKETEPSSPLMFVMIKKFT